ncbi:MAG: 3-deoxy-8-phosphooctulonate synthase [candidate division Zixibacteria bacterium]|nr:3-deoxy-8-phosphooctulonate synthase [candidate division Zixibacteria bacterium]
MAGSFKTGAISVGNGQMIFIAGPCVIESEESTFKVAEKLAKLKEKHTLQLVFKSSYLKANRTAIDSYTGPGIDKGLDILRKVKDKFGLPILTDVHSVADVAHAADVADFLQIPAFLCRQTDLAVAVGKSGKAVNIKKGQFMAPEDMANIARKIESTGNNKIMLTERGTSFGYHNLVVDFRSFVIMRKLGYPVIYDATHSVQIPGGLGNASGGNPEFIIPLAKAAVACGVDGLFFETHPEPSQALCDADCQLPLAQVEMFLRAVLSLTDNS